MNETAALRDAIRRFEPVNGDWRPLGHMISELCGEPLSLESIDTLLSVLERFPTEDGSGVLWSIVHALEQSPLYPGRLLASLRRQPAELSVVMVNRLLNAGERQLAGVPALDVLLEVSNRDDIAPAIRECAKSFHARHAV